MAVFENDVANEKERERRKKRNGNAADVWLNARKLSNVTVSSDIVAYVAYQQCVVTVIISNGT
jgi:dihydroxyacetone kinase